jgi:hypothetical protein
MQASDGDIYGVIRANASSCHAYSTSSGNLIEILLLGSLTGAAFLHARGPMPMY